jgi:hypothetical protein
MPIKDEQVAKCGGSATMKFANTVLGPISTDELGTTLIHEHLVYGYRAGTAT